MLETYSRHWSHGSYPYSMPGTYDMSGSRPSGPPITRALPLATKIHQARFSTADAIASRAILISASSQRNRLAYTTCTPQSSTFVIYLRLCSAARVLLMGYKHTRGCSRAFPGFSRRTSWCNASSLLLWPFWIGKSSTQDISSGPRHLPDA